MFLILLQFYGTIIYKKEMVKMKMKKLILLGTVIFFLLAISSLGQAAVTTVGSSEVTSGQGILPSSGPTAVLGLNMTQDAAETLTAVTVTFTSKNSNEAFVQGDLADTTTSPTTVASGVTLYYDDGSITGEFDVNDTHIPCNVAGWATITLTLVAAHAIPVNDTGANEGDDFFVVIRTSDNISGVYYTGGDKRDMFTVSFPTASVQAGGVWNTPTGTLITDTVTCESRVVDITPMRSDTNTYTNTANTYYPGDYAGDSTYRYKHFVPYELEDPDNDYYWYNSGSSFTAKSQLLPMFTYTAVLGIDCAAPRGCQTAIGSDIEYLSNVIATFTDSGTAGNFDPTTDIYDVSLWRDENDDGIFDSSTDTWLDNSSAFVGGASPWTITLTPTSSEPIDSTVNNTVDYFVVIRTHPWRQDDPVRIPYGADFKASIESGDVNFSVAAPANGLCRTAANCKEIKAVLEMHNYVYSTAPPPLNFGQIDATSGPVPVIGINAVDRPDWNESILSIKVTFSGNNFTPSDLASLSTGLSSGVSLWKDSKSDGHFGTFDPTRSRYDTIIPINTSSWTDEGGGEYSVILYPQTALQLLDDDTYTDTNRGDDYFICVRTSESIEYLDTIIGEVKDTDIQFGGAKSASGAFTASALTANAYVSLTDLTSYGQLMSQGETIPCIKVYCKRPAATPVSLESLVCQIDDMGTGTFGIGDLKNLDTDPTVSGIAIYKDNGDGVFGGGDAGIALSSIGLCNLPTEDFFRIELVLNAADAIPAAGTTYYLIIRTSNTLDELNDIFAIRLWGSMVTDQASKALGFDDGAAKSRTYERLETNILGPTPPPPPAGLGTPANLEAIPGVNVISLRWEDKSTIEDGFTIQRKIAGTGNYEDIAAVTGGTFPNNLVTYDNLITDDEIDNTYTYRVRAYDVTETDTGYNYEYSFWSNEVTRGSYTFSHIIGEGGGGSGCFIATAAFGTEMAKEVIALRKFRDKYLLTSPLGRDFVKLYYKTSPPIANFIRNKPLLKAIVRMQLKPLVWWSRFLLSQE